MNKKTILLGHGSGGKMSHDLILKLFVSHFDNPVLKKQTDSAILQINSSNIAFTTDSYVVDPIFFPGGNIGKLAVCGTVNDLAVSGAKPLYLSASFIIEEGFELTQLEEIVKTMADEAHKAGVLIVTGDTKVVNKGKCDKLFITTSGIGIIEDKNKHIAEGKNISVGDKIIINGFIGDHGIAVMSKRESLQYRTEIISDCASLNNLINEVTETVPVKFMRDATRGGIATVLAEIATTHNLGIVLSETEIPVREGVRGICEVFGFDPLYVANEGKVIMIVDPAHTNKAISIMKKNNNGTNATIIGEIVNKHPGKVVLQTSIGGQRIVDMLAGEQLPRIC